MIELEQIKKTDPIKMLRGQLNKAFSEIVADPIFTSGVMRTYSDNANALDFYLPFAATTFTNGVYYITF